jgi:hypothetical protein
MRFKKSHKTPMFCGILRTLYFRLSPASSLARRRENKEPNKALKRTPRERPECILGFVPRGAAYLGR